jgi:hypothetical protein
MNKDTSIERFWSQVTKTDGCWLWTGYTRKGYGTIKVNGEQITTHRFSFFLHYGHFPNICRHACDTPACVNPEHLLDGTHQDNRRDCVTRNRHGRGARFKGVTHCQAGHEYTTETTYKWVDKAGRVGRYCRVCQRRRMREYRRKKRIVHSDKNEKVI